MSKLKQLVITMVLMAMPLAAHADIRLKGGTVLVSIGDNISKMLKHKKSQSRYKGRVCRKPSNHACKSRGTAYGTIYEFKMSNRTYVVQTFHGTITHVDWHF